MALGDESRQARMRVEHDRIEGRGGVSIAEVPAPTAQELVESLHDGLDWQTELASVREFTDPVTSSCHRLT
jgi:hypothetical protein